jgi:hypothetical protein
MPELPGGLWYPEERRKLVEPEEVEQTPEADEPLPQLIIETPERTLIITPNNAVVRKFEAGDGEFDHIIHQLPGSEESIAIFLSGEDPQMREHIETNPYRIFEAREPDGEVYGYYAAAVAKSMGNTFDLTD